MGYCVVAFKSHSFPHNETNSVNLQKNYKRETRRLCWWKFLSGAISPLDVRSKTAKKLVSDRITGVIYDLLDVLEEGSTGGFTVYDKSLTIEPEKPAKGGRGPRPPLKTKKRPPFEKRLKKVKKDLNEIMAELEANVKKSLEDNRDEKRVQVILSIILFIAGISIISMGVLRNQLEIVATAAIPGLFILYPYNNLTKIRRENTFLYSLVPWIKTNLLPCELHEDPKDVAECYRNGLKKLNSWMNELQLKTYGS